VVPDEIQQAPTVGWLVSVAQFKMHRGRAIALRGEYGTHLAASVPARIGEKYLAGGSGMFGQKTCKQGRMIPLVQEVAADDEIEAAQFQGRFQPWGVEEGNGCESIEICVLAEKFLCQGMVVAGGDVGPALLQDEAGEANPTTDLENLFAGDGKATHLLGEREPRRPHDAKERPGGGGDSNPFGATVRVGELLPIAKGSNLIGDRPDLIAGRLDLVPSCIHIHVGTSIDPSRQGGYGFRDSHLIWGGLKRSWYSLDQWGTMIIYKPRRS